MPNELGHSLARDVLLSLCMPRNVGTGPARGESGSGSTTRPHLQRKPSVADAGEWMSLLPAFFQLLHHVVDAEAGWFLPRREVFEALDPLAHVGLRRNQQEGAMEHPIGVVDRVVLGLLERIAAQI